MQFKIGDKYHGFRLIEEKNVKETNSTVWLFQHEKSGARLFYMENEEDNKVFSITFRTPPKDRAASYIRAFSALRLQEVSDERTLRRACEGLIEYLSKCFYLRR